ncbi:MAG: PA2169 family four-helix-bundle protein [Anaerolineae bacterium]
MEQSDLQALDKLIVILDAGERGYAIAAANVNNRALKLLFKTYARQRADFKQELAEQSKDSAPRSHALVALAAMIHRGRINIFAALTIGELQREHTVLKEVLVGERAALKVYEQALAKPLPASVKSVVQRQYEKVQDVVQHVAIMHGESGKQVVVRLFDTHRDAARAAEGLRHANFDPAALEKVSMEKETDRYEGGRRSTLLETVLSGASGGALWGSVAGTVMGLGALQLPGLAHAALPIREFAWALIALSSILAGAFVGAVLGTFIGWGIRSGDEYLYSQSQEHGRVIVRLETTPERAEEAALLLAQVNREVRSGAKHVLA